MSRLAIIGATAIAALIMASAAVAGGGATLTLSFDENGGVPILDPRGDDVFVGQLSASEGCQGGRELTFFLKERGERDFEPEQTGATEADGSYEVTAPDGRISPGRYYVVAAAAGGCDQVRSKTVAFPLSRVTLALTGGDRAQGEIRSSERDCRAQRPVRILRKLRGAEEFRQVGNGRTKANGRYSVRIRGGLKPGRYFTRALEQGVCGIDRSQTVQVARARPAGRA